MGVAPLRNGSHGRGDAGVGIECPRSHCRNRSLTGSSPECRLRTLARVPSIVRPTDPSVSFVGTRSHAGQGRHELWASNPTAVRISPPGRSTQPAIGLDGGCVMPSRGGLATRRASFSLRWVRRVDGSFTLWSLNMQHNTGPPRSRRQSIRELERPVRWAVRLVLWWLVPRRRLRRRRRHRYREHGHGQEEL